MAHRRGFTLIELMIVVAILAILSVVAVPSFIKYMRRAKTTEAIDLLSKMVHGAATYFATPHISPLGERVPCQFPANQGVTPVQGTCCGDLGGPDADGDDRCDSDPTIWDTEQWNAVSFDPRDAHYFVYGFESAGTLAAAEFVASAHGDLDCDGISSTFQRRLGGGASTSVGECSVETAAAPYILNETE